MVVSLNYTVSLDSSFWAASCFELWIALLHTQGVSHCDQM